MNSAPNCKTKNKHIERDTNKDKYICFDGMKFSNKMFQGMSGLISNSLRSKSNKEKKKCRIIK